MAVSRNMTSSTSPQRPDTGGANARPTGSGEARRTRDHSTTDVSAPATHQRGTPDPNGEPTAAGDVADEAAEPVATPRYRTDDRAAFLRRLEGRLGMLADAAAIEHEVARALVEQLGALRAGFAEAAGDPPQATVTCLVEHDAAHSAAPGTDARDERALIALLQPALHADRTLHRPDIDADESLDPAARAAHRAVQAAASLTVPLPRPGLPGALLFVHFRQSRQLDIAEIALAEDAAQRGRDAALRALALAALHDSEARQRTLLQSLDDGFCVVELLHDAHGTARDYRFLEINPAFRWHTGLRENPVGRSAAELMPDEVDECTPVLARVAHTGVPERFQRHSTALGRHLDLYAFLLDARGPAAQVAVLVRDISAQVQADTALRASDARLAFLLRLNDALRPLDDPLAIPAVACRLLAEHLGVHRAIYADIVGDEAVVRGSHVRAVAPLPSRFRYTALAPRLVEAYQQGKSVTVNDIETDQRLNDDERRAYRRAQVAAFAAVLLFREGRWVGAFDTHSTVPRRWTPEDIALIHDVGERIWSAVERARAESALRASEARYRALVTQLPGAAVFVVGPDLRFLAAAGEALATVGLTPEDLIGRSIFDGVDPGQRSTYERNYLRVLAGESFEADHSVRGRVFRSRGVPLRDEHGQVTAALVASHDITDRRRIEEALKSADRRKDEFLATLAHELRNPLAPLRNGLHIARIGAGRDATLLRTLDMMDRQLAHLVRLVDDLLDVGRISAGKLELQRAPVRLAEALASSIDAARVLIEARGHELEVEVEPGELCVDGDFDRLAQVFNNLLTNAAKYTERGGRIRVGLRRDGAQAVLRVADSGIGIPPEELPRVFDLFSQVRSHQAQAGGGLGIGLSLVKQLVEMHGGSVQADSAGLGHGSEFTVRLPLLTTVGTPGDTGAAPTDAAAARRWRVLVVDDNVDAGASLADVLRIKGHQVALAHNGPSALALAHSALPDLVLLDLGMPGMDGVEVARRLRAMPEVATRPHGRLHLVALTGWGQEADRARTRAAGFDAHLVKPVDMSVLDGVLASIALAEH